MRTIKVLALALVFVLVVVAAGPTPAIGAGDLTGRVEPNPISTPRGCPEGQRLIDARSGGFTVALACVPDLLEPTQALEVYCPNIGVVLEGTYCDGSGPYLSAAPWGLDSVSCGDIVVPCQPVGAGIPESVFPHE